MYTYKDFIVESVNISDYNSLFKKYGGWTNGQDWFIPMMKKDGTEYVMEIDFEKEFYNRGKKEPVWEIGEVLYKDGRSWQNYYYDRGKVLATKIRMPLNRDESLKGMETALRFIKNQSSLDKSFIIKLENLLKNYSI